MPDSPAPDSAPTPGSPDERKARILGKLLASDETYYASLERTTERARRFLTLDRSGRILLTDLGSAQNVPDQIRLVLMGRKFTADMGIVPGPRIEYSEIAKLLNRPPKGVTTELSEIVRRGEAERPENGVFTVNPARIEGMLDAIESSKSSRRYASDTSTQGPRAPPRPAPRRPPRADPVLDSVLATQIPAEKYAWVKGEGSALVRGLAALLIARDEAAQGSLSPTEADALLTKKFGLKMGDGGVRSAFRKAKGREVQMVEDGAHVRYALTKIGEQRLEAARAGQTGGQ